MFCLSSRGRFATRILVLLAGGPEGKCFTKQEIATREGLTPAYVQQLMGTLQSAGLVIGLRGKQGGFKMARSPETITVGEALRVMEGCIRLAPCQEGGNCNRIPDCPTRHVWVEAASLLQDHFERTTIADLARQARSSTEQGETDNDPTYQRSTSREERGVNA